MRLLALSMMLIFACSMDMELAAQELVASNTCAMCHVSDGQIMTIQNVDESPVGSWMASVMAFASQDPYWRAKMEAEVLDRPGMKAEIEAECLACHAPVASAKAQQNGEKYSRAHLSDDALGLDGVSCLSCHRISPDNLGNKERMSGHIEWVQGETVYGPYRNPLQRPMWMHTGFVPQYGEHIKSSELCASCHNLYTPIFDEDNQKVGEFPEQTVYSEWAASAYAQDGQTCQTCHMPALRNDSRVSLMPPFAPVRDQIWSHRIVGGNTFLLDLLKYKRDVFGISKNEFDFEKTLFVTRAFLMTAAEIRLEVQASAGNTIEVGVDVINLTGHKFPTGYPERRAWIHFRAVDEAGQVVFESGGVDSLGYILDGEGFEPHHDVIDDSKQVQIYEVVVGDRQGKPTRRLLRSALKKKDNRLLPIGLDEKHERFSEDVAVVGSAKYDDNFSRADGSDRVVYRVQRPPQGKLFIACSLNYQAVPPGAIDDLRTFDGQDVSQFIEIVDQAKPTMFEVIATDSVVVGF